MKEISHLSSEATTTTASVSSEIHIQALCLVQYFISVTLCESGNTLQAEIITSFFTIIAQSCNGDFGKKMLIRSSLDNFEFKIIQVAQ